MKRMLALAAAAAAVLVPASAADATHICVTRHGEPVVCTAHLEEFFERICVTSGGQPVVCFP